MNENESREGLVDVLAMSPMSDYIGTDPRPMMSTADHILASDWLAEHVAAAVAAERERIAVAIEAAGQRKPRDPQWMWAADAAVAARIARSAS